MTKSITTPPLSEAAKDALLAKFLSKEGGPLYITIICDTFTIDHVPAVLKSTYCRWAYHDRDSTVDIYVVPIIHVLGLLNKGDIYIARVDISGNLIVTNLRSQGSLC